MHFGKSSTLRALIFAGIKCCGINFCGTNFCDFDPKSQKLVPQMFPNSSNRKNKFRKISHFIQSQNKFEGEPISGVRLNAIQLYKMKKLKYTLSGLIFARI